MSLICLTSETPTIQCVASEHGVRCNHGSRNRKRKLCAKHYARWQRHGTTDFITKGNRRSSDEVRKELLEKERLLIKQGLSAICLCAHVFLKHGEDKCKERYCKCKKFSSTNADKFYRMMAKFDNLGFSAPLNNTAECNVCRQRVVVGFWHDQHVLVRMREHVKIYHLSQRKLRVG